MQDKGNSVWCELYHKKKKTYKNCLLRTLPKYGETYGKMYIPGGLFSRVGVVV